MKKIFDLEGSTYRILSKGYMLLKLNIFFVIFSIPIVTIGPFINSVADRIINNDDSFTFSDILKEMANRLNVLKLWIGILVGLMLFVILTIILPKEYLVFSLMSLSLFMIICINSLIGGDFHQKQVINIIRVPAIVSFKYIGIFCGIALVYIVPPILFIFVPRLLIFWFLFGFSVPFYVHVKSYEQLEGRLFVRITEEKINDNNMLYDK
ncbi:hypothetical protein I4Q36_03360 [Tuanshanicoccus lijuaniae]|uniref:hypothetical protein n=1 Tax=Aerococcaceae bacterium zg-1292 TaxID=2774330 RepID=UPI001934D822|nr:hypothetical protein I4Q36_03360 [Aerococcaceae bacterium zg-1292]